VLQSAETTAVPSSAEKVAVSVGATVSFDEIVANRTPDSEEPHWAAPCISGGINTTERVPPDSRTCATSSS
jgi:hypothetical protein